LHKEKPVRQIAVRLFATLRNGRGKIYTFPPETFKTAADVLDYFQILPENVSIYQINGMHSSLEDAIKDGDIIALFPPVGGG